MNVAENNIYYLQIISTKDPFQKNILYLYNYAYTIIQMFDRYI